MSFSPAESLAGARIACDAPRIESASTSAYTVLGLLREMATLMRPFIVSGKPPPLTFVHVFPASVLFQSALPTPPLLRKYGPRTRS